MMFRFSVLLLAIGLSPCAALADESQPEAPSLYIEGYADQLSYQAGDKARLHVSTSAPKWSLEVARIGAKTETVLNKNDIPGAAHPVPVNASSHGCRWPVSIELEVPDVWRSGYYEAMLRTSDNGGEFVGRGRRTAEAKLFGT